MILTGFEIARAVAAGDIEIDPFEPCRISANSYDWRLGDQIRCCTGDLDAALPSEFVETTIPATGLVLLPNVLYLGITYEKTGSERYVQLINGDRTVGALGIWVHISAPLGHVGHSIRWTLEIRVVRPVRVYPGMTFGKIVFLRTLGATTSYQKDGHKYRDDGGIRTSRLYEEI